MQRKSTWISSSCASSNRNAQGEYFAKASIALHLQFKDSRVEGYIKNLSLKPRWTTTNLSRKYCWDGPVAWLYRRELHLSIRQVDKRARQIYWDVEKGRDRKQEGNKADSQGLSLSGFCSFASNVFTENCHTSFEGRRGHQASQWAAKAISFLDAHLEEVSCPRRAIQLLPSVSTAKASNIQRERDTPNGPQQ